MKKEGGMTAQEVQKKYGLEKFPPSEFLNRILKEFIKYDKKLVKIAKCEAMQKEGKPLIKDQIDLMSKKEEFKSHLDSLKVAIKLYYKDAGKAGEAPAPVAESPKDVKGEIDSKVKEFCSTATKRLGYFFAISAALADKDRVTPNPLASLSLAQQAELSKMFKTMVHIDEEKDTTLAEEAEKASEVISQILKKGAATETIDKIMSNNEMIEMNFRITAPKPQEYSTTQPISVGKDMPVEIPKKEVPTPQPVHEPVAAKEEYTLKETTEAIKAKDLSVPQKVEEEKVSSWAEAGAGEEEEEELEEGEKPQEGKEWGYAPEEEEEEPEEEFEVAKSKSEERKQRVEGRGQYRGRGGRGRRRGGFGEGRGEFRGRRSRGAQRGRGEPRGPRRGKQ